MPAPVIAIVAASAAPAVGAAVASTIIGATVSTAVATAIGGGVIAGVATLAQGGDVSDALENAVKAGVGSYIGGAVSNVVGSAIATGSPEVVTNAISNAAGSAASVAVTGGDVNSAALMGLAGGAGATLGRELGTVLDYKTDPFSQQTAFLKAQEVGMGTAGGLGATAGVAAGQIAAGRDPEQAALAALTRAAQEEIRSLSRPVDYRPATDAQVPPPSPQENLIPDQISQELPAEGGPPEYGVQDLGITPENLASFQQNLLQMQEEGRMPSQWRVGEDGTFTYTSDDGSTITINESGDVLGFTQAPPGALLSDITSAPEERTESPRPIVRESAISGGRREGGGTFGPTVRTLGEALAPPLFPTSPAAGLTAVRGAGEIESGATGKERRNVWNEASLRLKDALGI